MVTMFKYKKNCFENLKYLEYQKISCVSSFSDLLTIPIFQVMSAIDDLLEWFEDTEGKLMRAQPISCEPTKLQSQLSDQRVSI